MAHFTREGYSRVGWKCELVKGKKAKDEDDFAKGDEKMLDLIDFLASKPPEEKIRSRFDMDSLNGYLAGALLSTHWDTRRAGRRHAPDPRRGGQAEGGEEVVHDHVGPGQHAVGRPGLGQRGAQPVPRLVLQLPVRPGAQGEQEDAAVREHLRRGRERADSRRVPRRAARHAQGLLREGGVRGRGGQPDAAHGRRD
ncbi:hypothetical protein FGB62_143g00 [Gracilaria domingensis]|nr:hypothetical protein FGB62_143g00 [Gracilaria domingensis]